MTMKKRFLGLALAAMVAVPATTAYANTVTITGDDTQILPHEVRVSGSVSTKQGVAPSGRLQVELPTAMAFTVDEASNFNAPTYTVKNKSAVGITVAVSEFRETNKDGGINLEDISNFNDTSIKDRSHIGLSLNGYTGGSSTSIDLSQVDPSQTAEDILDVRASDSGVLSLTGIVGTKAEGDGNLDQTGAQEDFTLVFKIRKNDTVR